MAIILAEDEMESREQAHLSGIYSIGHKDERQRDAVGHRCGTLALEDAAGARLGMLVALTDFKQKKLEQGI